MRMYLRRPHFRRALRDRPARIPWCLRWRFRPFPRAGTQIRTRAFRRLVRIRVRIIHKLMVSRARANNFIRAARRSRHFREIRHLTSTHMRIRHRGRVQILALALTSPQGLLVTNTTPQLAVQTQFLQTRIFTVTTTALLGRPRQTWTITRDCMPSTTRRNLLAVALSPILALRALLTPVIEERARKTTRTRDYKSRRTRRRMDTDRSTRLCHPTPMRRVDLLQATRMLLTDMDTIPRVRAPAKPSRRTLEKGRTLVPRPVPAEENELNPGIRASRPSRISKNRVHSSARPASLAAPMRHPPTLGAEYLAVAMLEEMGPGERDSSWNIRTRIVMLRERLSARERACRSPRPLRLRSQ